jgi:LysR family glycine cleavage system transcriptional activator
MSRLPPLNSLRTFEVAARRLNFSHAADELNVTPSAVSHQIKGLEAHLRVVLFHRMHRGLSLTAAGELMLPGIRSGLAAFEQALDGLETRFLTVSVPPSVAVKWLVPRLGAFKAAY